MHLDALVMKKSCGRFDCGGLLLEKPRDFDPFGQAGLSPLATI